MFTSRFLRQLKKSKIIITLYETLHYALVYYLSFKQVLPILHADSKGTTVVCFKLQSIVTPKVITYMVGKHTLTSHSFET